MTTSKTKSSARENTTATPRRTSYGETSRMGRSGLGWWTARRGGRRTTWTRCPISGIRWSRWS